MTVKTAATALAFGLFALPAAAQDAITKIQGGLNKAAGTAGFGTTPPSVPEIIGRLIQAVLGFIGVLLLVYLLYGGFRWMTAGGDTKKVDDARSILKNAVIGIVIVAASFAISGFVLQQLQTVFTSGSGGVTVKP